MIITVLKIFVLVAAITLAVPARAQFTLTSPAFKHEKSIPAKYTCEGENISPELSWSGAPKDTKSFALLVHDPDAPDPKAPKNDWVHWIIFNIPAKTEMLHKGITTGDLDSLGACTIINDSQKTDGKIQYDGPCPPIGTHRYFFELYALSGTVVCPPKNTKLSVAKFRDHIKGKVLGQATLMGTYQKK